MEMKLKMAKITAILLVLVVLGGLPAQAGIVSIKLTSDALGLGGGKINDTGGIVDADVPGLITSPTIGEGSILKILESGIAGNGTFSDPLFVTVTAQTRLDVTGLTTPKDYYAGIIYISPEKTNLPDGAEEGLGVRAFTVDNNPDSDTYLERVINSDVKKPLRAKYEGSKDVSGGTNDERYVENGIVYKDDKDGIPIPNANGAPHVDEAVTFTFNPDLNVEVQNVEVLLSKFDDTDIIDLNIELKTTSSIDKAFLQTTAIAFTEVGSNEKLWKLSFADIEGINPGDVVENFTIYANDDNPSAPSGTAEHFLITGMNVVPVPGAVLLGMIGLGVAGVKLRKYA